MMRTRTVLLMWANGKRSHAEVEEAIEKKHGGWEYGGYYRGQQCLIEPRKMIFWNGHDRSPYAMHRPGEVVS